MGEQGAWWMVVRYRSYIGKSIEWLCMEDCHSVKLSRLLALTVLVLNGSLFRNLTLVSYWAHCFSPALSQARRGPTHPVTVMFYTPRGRAAIRNPWP